MAPTTKKDRETWNWTKFITSMIRPERWVLVITLASLIRDNFKDQYGSNATTVFMAHAILMAVCIFAESIRKFIDKINVVKIKNLELQDTDGV